MTHKEYYLIIKEFCDEEEDGDGISEDYFDAMTEYKENGDLRWEYAFESLTQKHSVFRNNKIF